MYSNSYEDIAIVETNDNDENRTAKQQRLTEPAVTGGDINEDYSFSFANPRIKYITHYHYL